MVPYLLFVELGILSAICLYCTMMHIAIVVDFGIISYLLFYKKGIGQTCRESADVETQATADVGEQESISTA